MYDFNSEEKNEIVDALVTLLKALYKVLDYLGNKLED